MPILDRKIYTITVINVVTKPRNDLDNFQANEAISYPSLTSSSEEFNSH